MRWLGIDYGTRRVGVAVGDADSRLASPAEVLEHTGDLASLLERLASVAADYGAVGVVVGWPLNMDGSEGPQGRLARAFAAELAGNGGLDVRMWDERLSSAAADHRLAGSFTRKQKKARHDAVAATVILQDFLNGDGPAVAAGPDDATPPA